MLAWNWDYIILTLGPWLLAAALGALLFVLGFGLSQWMKPQKKEFTELPPHDEHELQLAIAGRDLMNAYQELVNRERRIVELEDWYDTMTKMWQNAERLRAKWHRIYKIKNNLLKGFLKP